MPARLEQLKPEVIAAAAQNARRALVQHLTPAGHWEGHLSSSALSTAVAVAALALVDARAHADYVRRGLTWLSENQNRDGGWGDTPASPANLSTTLLCWAAFNHKPNPEANHATLERAEQWLKQRLGSLDASQIAARVLAAYGKDRTFSVPILTFCALSRRLGDDRQAWANIPQLPFELSALPHQLFKWLRLPVVSYAVPALIAIGLARHEHTPRSTSPLRWLRDVLKSRVLRILRSMQPASGGFLEAIPLTGFVVSALAASGFKQHPVTTAGTEFLRRAFRADGSWPIDINLSTWVTTLSIDALWARGCHSRSSAGSERGVELPNTTSDNPSAAAETAARRDLVNWLLNQQHQVEHPFTHAAPGGWAWTDLSGGVPDADDTAGALLALLTLDAASPNVRAAAARGIQWLLDLQNRDGGIATFCRGWSNLPFDRSCPDITAHALAAWAAWLPHLEPRLQAEVRPAIARALDYLLYSQRTDGTWIPLWFGNQHAPRTENPLYGTARVLLALAKLPNASESNRIQTAITRAQNWLRKAQHPEGGWGGSPESPPSVEETALALDALLATGENADSRSIHRGLGWLLRTTDLCTAFPATPIGLYFAALWYSEELYPVVFTCSALRRMAKEYPHA